MGGDLLGGNGELDRRDGWPGRIEFTFEIETAAQQAGRDELVVLPIDEGDPVARVVIEYIVDERLAAPDAAEDHDIVETPSDLGRHIVTIDAIIGTQQAKKREPPAVKIAFALASIRIVGAIHMGYAVDIHDLRPERCPKTVEQHVTLVIGKFTTGDEQDFHRTISGTGHGRPLGQRLVQSWPDSDTSILRQAELTRVREVVVFVIRSGDLEPRRIDAKG